MAWAPAEAHEIGVHRFRQIAHVAPFVHGLRAVTLGELLAVLAVDQRDVREERGRPIQRALDHLHRLYEEVRDYASPIKLEKQPCDLGHLWRDAWSHLEVVRKTKDVQLTEQIGNVDLACNVDSFAIGQVFRNIFENALAASPEPGKIVLGLAAISTKAPTSGSPKGAVRP